MALYLDEKNVKKASPSDAFKVRHKPGKIVPHSGIYRCIHCGDEVACNKGDPFPPQNHDQHHPGTPIEWQLLVYSVQK